jgi:hypothetical protein
MVGKPEVIWKRAVGAGHIERIGQKIRPPAPNTISNGKPGFR